MGLSRDCLDIVEVCALSPCTILVVSMYNLLYAE